VVRLYFRNYMLFVALLTSIVLFLFLNMKAYSQDLRDRAIYLYENMNYSNGKISKLLKIGCQTLSDWIKRYKETGDYSSKQHLVK